MKRILVWAVLVVSLVAVTFFLGGAAMLETTSAQAAIDSRSAAGQSSFKVIDTVTLGPTLAQAPKP
jgi:hypothetical protein